MMRIPYDLHVHSCLSPCGDGDMTPNSIAGMASLNGIRLLALTDHNTTGNCAAFYTACRRYGVIPVAGAELTTAEDIHLVVLFRSLEAALDFNRELDAHRILYPNRADIFGEQLYVDDSDTVLASEPNLLTNALSLSLDEAVRFARQFDAAVYPAHIDRESNGAIAVLGDFPRDSGFTAFELHSGALLSEYGARFGLERLSPVVSSDAHVLWDISEGENALSLEGESEDEIRASLFAYLGGAS